jgi:aminoglycoside phosphotransferase (APT) family kinase protein
MWANDASVTKKVTAHLLEILIELHNISPNEIGLSKLGRPEGYLERTANGWFKRAQIMWPAELPKTVHYIMSWLEDNKVAEQAPVLLHNDFKLDNIIFNPKNLIPVALIDWDLGTRGDPLWDLAVLLSYWAEPDDPKPMLQLGQMPTASIGFPRRQDIIDIYASKSGRDVANIKYYRVLAQFRLAVVFKQIFEKYKEQENLTSNVSRFDSLSLGLLEFAVQVATGEFD